MTFQELTIQEKIEHIWEYYRVHMAVTACVLLFAGTLLNIYLINPAPDVILDVTVRIEQKYYNKAYQDTLKAKLMEGLATAPESQTVMVELLATDENMDPNVFMATEAKFMGKSEVQDLDILIIDEPNYLYMLSEGYFMDLAQLESEFGIQLPDAAKVYSTGIATQTEKPFALDVRKIQGLAPIIIGDENVHFYACIFVRSEKEEKAMMALRYLSQ